jgi:nitrogen fixation NifU-like protein
MKKTKDKLLEHFLRPRNVGSIEKADGFASVENPINKYRTDIYIKIKNDIVEDIKFKTIGCTATIASASALTEIVKGKELKDLIIDSKTFDNLYKLIIGELGNVPEKNWHCPPTAILGFIKAIKDYYKKNNNKTKIQEINTIIDQINNFFKETLSKL